MALPGGSFAGLDVAKERAPEPVSGSSDYRRSVVFAHPVLLGDWDSCRDWLEAPENKEVLSSRLGIDRHPEHKNVVIAAGFLTLGCSFDQSGLPEDGGVEVAVGAVVLDAGRPLVGVDRAHRLAPIFITLRHEEGREKCGPERRLAAFLGPRVARSTNFRWKTAPLCVLMAHEVRRFQ